MKRLDKILQLKTVQENIEHTEHYINQEIPPYYSEFNKLHEWNHKIEIWKKALAFWKRKFNRIIDELKYI